MKTYIYTTIQLIDDEVKYICNKLKEPKLNDYINHWEWDAAYLYWKENHKIFEFDNQEEIDKVFYHFTKKLGFKEYEKQLINGIQITCIEIKDGKVWFKSEDVTINEFILCAANYYNDGLKETHSVSNIDTGFVICGRRHHNCISIFAKMYGFPYSDKVHKIQQTEVQGFITNTNRFVTRLEALEIAKKSKQITTGEGNSKLGLFSEDLY